MTIPAGPLKVLFDDGQTGQLVPVIEQAGGELTVIVNVQTPEFPAGSVAVQTMVVFPTLNVVPFSEDPLPNVAPDNW